MLLSNNDIYEIEKIGFDNHYYVRSKNGWLKLKNKDGRCIFHDGKTCLIYESRPEGCKLYPLIFNKEYKSAVVDEECPYGDNFRFDKLDINQLYDLVSRIKNERTFRRKKTIKNKN